MAGTKCSSKGETVMHLCLAYRGKGVGCNACGIMVRGFCETALAVLEYGSRKLSSEYRSFSDLDREEILANALIGMERNISTLKGNSQGQFFVWGYRILQRRIIDHFRRKAREYAFSITEEALANMAGEVPNEIIAMIEGLSGLIYNTEGEFKQEIDTVLGKTDAEEYWKVISRCSRSTRPPLRPPKPQPPEQELEQIAPKIKEIFPDLAEDVDFLMDIIRNRAEGKLQKDLAEKYRITVAVLKKRKERVVCKLVKFVERLYGYRIGE